MKIGWIDSRAVLWRRYKRWRLARVSNRDLEVLQDAMESFDQVGRDPKTLGLGRWQKEQVQ